MILDLYALHLVWDVFESLTCWLDLCLSSLFVCIHIFVFFHSLKNSFFYQVRQLLDRSSIDFYLSSPLDFFSQQILSHIRSIKLSGLSLDSYSIASRSIEKLSVWPIDSGQNLDPSRNFCRQQILDSTSTDSYLSRFSARQISTAPRSIEIRFLYIWSF